MKINVKYVGIIGIAEFPGKNLTVVYRALAGTTLSEAEAQLIGDHLTGVLRQQHDLSAEYHDDVEKPKGEQRKAPKRRTLLKDDDDE